MSDKIYKNEEVERIIKRAISNNTGSDYGITESELFRIASELNISREQVLRAMRDEKEFGLFEQAKQMWLDKRRSSFREHLIAFVIINAFLVGIDVFTTSGITWSVYPILGWGIGLAFDFIDSHYPSQAKVEAGAKKLMKSNKWKKLFDNVEGFIFDEVFKKIKF